MRFNPGVLLADRYRIVGRLGRGGMGEVYRADDLTLGESVALKFLPREVASDPTWMDRLRDEVRIARKVTHPNICRVHDLGEANGEPFLSMEYVDGEDLSTLLRRIGHLPEEKAVQIGRQLCAGLAAAHEKGVLHRDLKPANIMLDGRGQVRITDFGIAALAEDGSDGSTSGTPTYMAPELLDGGHASVRSDLYALGIVLYEVFTGGEAMDARTIVGDDRSRGARPTPSTSTGTTQTDQLDVAVQRVIRHCLRADPEARPPSAWAVATALPGGDPLAAAVAAGEMPSPELVAAAGGTRTLSPAIAAGLLVVTALCILATTVLREGGALYGHVPLDKPPAALVDRAQEVLDVVGSRAEPVDFASGYLGNGSYMRWIEARERDRAARIASYAEARPPRMFFWYRQSPVPYVARTSWPGRGYVGAASPAWSTPGEAYVSLNLDGQLRRLIVQPSPREGPADPAFADFEPDWPAVFRLAGLDAEAFTPCTSEYVPKFRVDQRWAWSGAYPGLDVALRIEAAVTDGVVTQWLLFAPWHDDDEIAAAEAATERPPSIWTAPAAFFRQWATRIGFFLMLGMLFIGSAILVRRGGNLRVDRTRAVRLGAYLFCVSVAYSAISGHRVLPRGEGEILHALSAAMFMAMGGWVGYVTIEPITRRFWPTVLVGWTRLLSRQWRDPLVGRNILVGIAAGAAGTVLYQIGYTVAGRGAYGIPLLRGNFGSADSLRSSIINLLVAVSLPLLMGFSYLLLLVFLRVFLKRRWLWTIAFVLLLPIVLFNNRVGFPLPWSLLTTGLWAVLVLVLFVREGVLAVMACVCTDYLLMTSPLTTDLGWWGAHATLLPLGLLIGISAFAFTAATSRPTTPGYTPRPIP